MTWHLTQLRAWDLWLTGNDIITAGFSDLLARARTEHPEAISWLTSRFDKEANALYELIFTTWLKDKNYTYTDKSQFEAQVNYQANQAVRNAIADYEAGKYKDVSWKPNEWLVSNFIQARRQQLISLASTQFGPTLADAIVDKPMREYETSLNATLNKAYADYNAWSAVEADAYNKAKREVINTKPAKKQVLMPEYLDLVHKVERAPRMYKNGANFYRLDMSKQEVEDALSVLSEQALKIPADSIQKFKTVYDAFRTYYDLIFNVPQQPDQGLPYERELVFSKSRIQALKDYAKRKFDEKNWYAVEVRAHNKDVNVSKLKADKLNNIYDVIDGVAKDPWTGPLAKDANYNTVPYAALPTAEVLYEVWISDLVDSAYQDISATVDSAPKTAKKSFAPTQSFIDALVKSYRNLWNTSVNQGVAGLSDARFKYSVKDPYFYAFSAWVNTQADIPYESIDSFEKAVADEYWSQRQAAIAKAESLLHTGSRRMPKEYLDIKSKVDNELDTFSTKELSSMLMALNILSSQIPPDYKSMLDYNTTISKIRARLDSLGAGQIIIPHQSDTVSYVDAATSRFDADTRHDREVADYLGWDFSQHRNAFIDGITSALQKLEGGYITSQDYVKAQAKAEKDAKDKYYVWRGKLIAAARTKLQGIIDKLKSSTELSQQDIESAKEAGKLSHPLLYDLIEQINLLVSQKLPGALFIAGALKPFARFTPLKSESGFDTEEFSFNHMKKLINNWLKPRLDKGETIYVNPKINGYRLILEVKNHEVRIYMEEDTRNFANVYKHLTAELEKLEDVILDGEMVESMDGNITPRAELAKFRRADVDDAHVLVCVFDILYWKGEDLHELPYEERVKLLDQFFKGRTFKHLKELPFWPVKSVEDAIKLSKKANDYPGSEGAMYKTGSSKYTLGKRTTEWSKIKMYSDLHVKVLGKTKTKGNDFVYRCGVLYEGEPDVAQTDIEEFGGRKYVVLGNTFRTTLNAKPGDKLEVAVSEVVESNSPQGKKYNWMLPKVKDFSYRDTMDNLEYVKRVGQLLQASIDQPFKKLADLYNEALTTTSIDELYNLKAQAWGYLQDFNYDRLRNYAYAIINLIRGRLGQAVDPSVTAAGVEKLYESPVHPRVTNSMLDDIEGDLNGVEDDIESDKASRLEKARAIRRTLEVNLDYADADTYSRIRALLARVEALIDTLKRGGSLSLIDYDHRLTDIENRARELIDNPTVNTSARAHELLTDLSTLASDMGSYRGHFQDRLDAISRQLEPYANPSVTDYEINAWLNDMKHALSSGVITHWQLGQIRGTLAGMQDRLTDWQKAIYKDRIDAINRLLNSVTISGATRPARRLDLGCGDAKPRGYIGIDIKPYKGVDKLWDLETGIPYADDSIDEVRANHVLEHLSDPVKIMTEIWRVLKPGGVLRFEFPSAKGEGAFADPTHKSYWTKLSLAFYTDDKLRGSHDIPCKYKLLTVEEKKDPKTGAVYTRGVMKAIKPDKLKAARLTNEGEESGTDRLDFMKKQPSTIPVKGVLWTHVKGIDPEHAKLDYEQLMKVRGDTLNLHHDLRFNWEPNYLEGITIFLGSQADRGKLLNYQGGKLGATIKERQPVIWNQPDELNGRLFPPRDVGNVSGSKTWGKMFLIDEVEMLPSRMRPSPKGDRYWEFYLKFKKHPDLNGLWALSEKSSAEYEIPFFLFRLKDETPFWLRVAKKHAQEISKMPDWQKPSVEKVGEFLGHSND